MVANHRKRRLPFWSFPRHRGEPNGCVLCGSDSRSRIGFSSFYSLIEYCITGCLRNVKAATKTFIYCYYIYTDSVLGDRPKTKTCCRPLLVLHWISRLMWNLHRNRFSLNDIFSRFYWKNFSACFKIFGVYILMYIA